MRQLHQPVSYQRGRDRQDPVMIATMPAMSQKPHRSKQAPAKGRGSIHHKGNHQIKMIVLMRAWEKDELPNLNP